MITGVQTESAVPLKETAEPCTLIRDMTSGNNANPMDVEQVSPCASSNQQPLEAAFSGTDAPGLPCSMVERDIPATVGQPVVIQPKSVQYPEENSVSSEPIIRRSIRQSAKPERLQYRQLGNPLLHVVNSLFQGLSDAFANSLPTDEIMSKNI